MDGYKSDSAGTLRAVHAAEGRLRLGSHCGQPVTSSHAPIHTVDGNDEPLSRWCDLSERGHVAAEVLGHELQA